MAPYNYSGVPQSEDNDGDVLVDISTKDKLFHRSVCGICLFGTVVFIVGVIIGVTLPLPLHLWGAPASHQSMSMPDGTFATCGSTPEEALEKGCVFDLMNYAWTPPECYSAQLLDDSLALYSKPWRWYSSQSRTPDTEVPQDPHILSKMDTVFGEHAYHVAHCLYMWRTLQWTLFGNLTQLQHHYATFEHQGHCIELLSREKENSATHAVIHLEYYSKIFMTCNCMENAYPHAWECGAPSHEAITFEQKVQYLEHKRKQHNTPEEYIWILSNAAAIHDKILKCPFGDDCKITKDNDKDEDEDSRFDPVFGSNTLRRHIAGHVKEIALFALQKLPSGSNNVLEISHSNSLSKTDAVALINPQESMCSVLDNGRPSFEDGAQAELVPKDSAGLDLEQNNDENETASHDILTNYIQEVQNPRPNQAGRNEAGG
ncbi:hypothetical protein BU24DRAFT_415924 [Aaosphaeria arxii CBS 175.79]|uniref:Uncharacterized protein n=1 Tax=Aaosphaeria arxii CBS 175.79 TaxID=1450172 RepID=A0A6A5X658_9PLEO|nr:uncharacterized protein BU24DRAFT_415924 [Aaosphaeria arxii CBS 175.79]KAF2008380.1 hypothetical protein BU24DRAFT_415924 [Aaosphaeria arxii CBS 175.79]